MLSTILKHEFHRTKQPLALLFGVASLALLVSVALTLTGLPAITTIAGFGATLVVGAFLWITILWLALDFYASNFGNQRYLTHSLPIPSSKLLWAKLLYAWGVALVALVWFAAGFFVSTTLMGVTSGVSLAQAWSRQIDVVRQILSEQPAWVPLGLSCVAVAFLLTYVIIAFASISVGSEKRFNRWRIGGAVLVFVIIYLALQLLLLLGIVAIPLGVVPDTGPVEIAPFKLSELFVADTEIVPLGFIPVMILTGAVLLWRTHRSWSARIDLR